MPLIPCRARRIIGARVPAAAAAALLLVAGAGTARITPSMAPAAASVGNVNLMGVTFGDANDGWAVGSGWDGTSQTSSPVVYHTTDGGTQWTAQAGPFSGYQWAIAAVGATHAWIAGDPYSSSTPRPSGLWATTDGGATWVPETLPTGLATVYGISFTSTTEGWALAPIPGGTTDVLHTTDGGTTWTPQALPASPAPASTTLQCLSVDFLDASHGWVGCSDPTRNMLVVESTTDGGATWTAHDAGPATFALGETPRVTVHFVSPSTGFTVGHGVYETTDGGTTWSPIALPCGTYEGMSFADGLHGWIGGYGCTSVEAGNPYGWPAQVLATSDGGHTWSVDPRPQSAGALVDIAATSSTSAVAVGYDNLAPYLPTLMSSSDGVHWATYGDRLWIGQGYQELLGRAADPGGVDYWLRVLTSGVPHGVVAQSLEDGPEFRGVQVAAVYQSLLHRTPDPAGLQSFVGALGGGATYEGVTATILGSDEYLRTRGGGTDAGWLAAVYQDVLGGRAVDPSGLTYWETQIGALVNSCGNSSRPWVEMRYAATSS